MVKCRGQTILMDERNVEIAWRAAYRGRHQDHTSCCMSVVCFGRTGIVCAGGSDAPVESPQPLLGIYDSIFRPAGNRLETTQQFRLVNSTSRTSVGLASFYVFFFARCVFAFKKSLKN